MESDGAAALASMLRSRRVSGAANLSITECCLMSLCAADLLRPPDDRERAIFLVVERAGERRARSSWRGGEEGQAGEW